MAKKITPFIIVFGCYLALHFFQLFVIFPLEEKYGSDLTWLASLFFLPHLVRVLAVWMLGPLAFFALLPADIIIHFIVHSGRQLTDIQILVPLVASGCAVIAFEFFKFAGINLYMTATNSSNWRPLLLIGAVASVLNSLGTSLLYQDLTVSENSLILVSRYLIGDVLGLFIGLFILMVIMRLLRLNAAR
tara:strand:+ start:134 stop:700 length:567 start_codon:yes stop_codon:yes gene_type:complete